MVLMLAMCKSSLSVLQVDWVVITNVTNALMSIKISSNKNCKTILQAMLRLFYEIRTDKD